MLKTLKSLLRVHDYRMKDLQRKLLQAQKNEDDMEQRIIDFDHKVEAERDFAMQNDFITQSSYSQYVFHAAETKQKLQSMLIDTQAITQAARNNVLKIYREKKQMEKVQERKLQEEQERRDLQEQKMVDDLVQSNHKRGDIF